MKDRYTQRGVSADKEEVHAAIKNIDKGLFPNAFCKVLPDFVSGDEDYCNIMHADTAGTKGAIAYMYWKETDDISVWKGIVQDAFVMNLDDIICAGITDNIVFSSTIGRNKAYISGKVISEIINATQSLIDQLKSLGINTSLAGGETADVGDVVRTIDVGFTAFARPKRTEVLEVNVQEGDVIVGLASSGKAAYEEHYNSGIGSNGLTSAKHDLFHKYLKKRYPETFDENIPENLVYCGKRLLTEIEKTTGRDYGSLILSPTRTYAPIIKDVLASERKNISGIIHCSGGGQTKVLKFVKNVHIIKDQLFETPVLFRDIQKDSSTPWREMYKVFNMGHRMEIYCKPSAAEQIIKAAKKYNVDAQIIGRVEASSNKKLTIKSTHGEFTYE